MPKINRNNTFARFNENEIIHYQVNGEWKTKQLSELPSKVKFELTTLELFSQQGYLTEDAYVIINPYLV